MEGDIDSFELANLSKVSVCTHSNLGYQLLARGNKVLFLNTDKDIYKWHFITNKIGLFWYKGENSKEIYEKFHNILNMNNRELNNQRFYLSFGDLIGNSIDIILNYVTEAIKEMVKDSKQFGLRGTFRGQGIGIAKAIISLTMFHQGRIWLTDTLKKRNESNGYLYEE